MKNNIISSHFWLKERMFLRLSSRSLSISKSTFHKIDYRSLSFNIYYTPAYIQKEEFTCPTPKSALLWFFANSANIQVSAAAELKFLA